MDEIPSPNEFYLSCIEGFRVSSFEVMLMNEIHHTWN
jgi:hypothetical protein